MLPLTVELGFKVDQLQWGDNPALQAQGLAGTYRFDGLCREIWYDAGLFSPSAAAACLRPDCHDHVCRFFVPLSRSRIC